MNGGLCFAGPHAASMKSRGQILEVAMLKYWWLVSIPSLLNFGGASALCLPRHCCIPSDCCPLKAAYAKTDIHGCLKASFFFFFAPLHKSCQLQPNCILFRQTVSGAMQMSFEMWRSGLYLSANCLSGTDI